MMMTIPKGTAIRIVIPAGIAGMKTTIPRTAVIMTIIPVTVPMMMTIPPDAQTEEDFPRRNPMMTIPKENIPVTDIRNGRRAG